MCLGIMTVPIINKVILGWVAFGAGFAVAGGFIAFISLIGIEQGWQDSRKRQTQSRPTKIAWH